MNETLFKAARDQSIPLERLLEGVDYPLSFLENKKERIEWPVFVRICANAGKIWTDRQLEELGGAFFKTPFVRSILIPARLLFTPRKLFQWVLGDPKGLGQQMVPCATNRYAELGPDRAALELTFPDGYERCPQYFTITKGAISGMPCALGLEPAHVLVTPLPNGARFEISYPPLRGFVYGVRSAITWPFTVRAAAGELKSAHEELVTRYKELEDYRLNLERKVEQRTEELNQTVAQLKEAQAARDKLFANINHEIRTPLALINLAVADVRRRRTDLDDKTYEQFDGVEASTRQLLRLIDGLLLLAAGQEDRLKLKLAPIDLAARARGTVSVWNNIAVTRGLTIRYEGPEMLPVLADEGAVDRILANLVSNAMKFTPTGGTVTVAISEKDGKTILSVTDTGIGIDAEFRKRIFGRFEQGGAAVHAGSAGSGVGLSLVRELARAHGGEAEVESPVKDARGSRFVITLPLAREEAGAAKAPSNGVSTTQAPTDFGIVDASIGQKPEIFEPTNGVAQATILVAEDNPRLRAQVVELLRADYRVLSAPDGVQALVLARKHLPDMLVSDIGMPVMDGIELTKKFRELNGNRLSPVLLLTAMGAVRKRLEGFEAGAVDYITKPFEPEELKARIRNQLLLRTLALRLHETEKTIALGVLSSGLAHELRNPANGITNAIAPLKKLLGDAVKPDIPAGKLFKVLEQCSEQVGTVSRQLLGLRGGELELTDTRVPDLIERAENLASGALKNCKFEKSVTYQDSIRCSSSTMLQVLGNLLENAAHAAGPAGWVKLSVADAGDRVVFEVADSGKGVPPEIRQKIFEPFFTTKPQGVGTGLGLSTARDIVLRHSGSIDVRDGSPGAVFRVELPKNPPSVKQVAAPA